MSPQAAAAVAIPDGSPLLRWSFVVLSLFIGCSFALGVRWSALRSHLAPAVANRESLIAAAGAALWLTATGFAAASGFLQFEPPPTMLGALAVTFAVGIAIGVSRLGRRLAVALPLAALVGFQGFRVVVELLMHRAYSEGLMPVQMSYSGRNFDIVSGLTALALGAWLATGRKSPRLVFAWNTLGVALLLNILVVALLSAPTPFRVFMNDPVNVWVTRAPWIWLPTVMVLAAVIGHVLVYRRLWIESRAELRAARVLVAPAIVAIFSVDACKETPRGPRGSSFGDLSVRRVAHATMLNPGADLAATGSPQPPIP